MRPLIEAVIICGESLGDPESVRRGHLLSGPRAAAAHSNSHRERGAHRASAIYLGAVFPVGKRTVCAINVRAGHTLPGSSSIHDTNSVRMNFSRPLRRPGSLIPLGNARFQCFQQSSRCVCQGLQSRLSCSSSSSCLHPEYASGVSHGAGWIGQPRGFLSQGGSRG